MSFIGGHTCKISARPGEDICLECLRDHHPPPLLCTGSWYRWGPQSQDDELFAPIGNNILPEENVPMLESLTSTSNAYRPISYDADERFGDHWYGDPFSDQHAIYSGTVAGRSGLEVDSPEWDLTNLHLPRLGSSAEDNTAALPGSSSPSSVPTTTAACASPGISYKRPKLYGCDVCPSVFSKENDLNRHKQGVHRMGDQSAYACRCGYKQVRKDNYKRHVRGCRRSSCHDFYVCRCSTQHEELEAHLDHITRGCQGLHCPAGKRGIAVMTSPE